MSNEMRLVTDDRITHELYSNGKSHKTTLCDKTFIAWVENDERQGPWHGVTHVLPTLQTRQDVDCMACISARTRLPWFQ